MFLLVAIHRVSGKLYRNFLFDSADLFDFTFSKVEFINKEQSFSQIFTGSHGRF